MTLKFPIKIILTYLHVCLFKISDKLSMKYLSFYDGGANTEPFPSFYGKLNENYFAAIGDFFKVHSFTRNIFIDIKNDSMFVSVPSIQLISMDLRETAASEMFHLILLQKKDISPFFLHQFFYS